MAKTKFEKYIEAATYLEKARDLLKKPGTWITGALARGIPPGDEWGGFDEPIELDPNNPNANTFCAVGALQKVGAKKNRAAHELLARQAIKKRGYPVNYYGHRNIDDFIEEIADYNDVQESFKPVLTMFNRAIKEAKKLAEAEKAQAVPQQQVQTALIETTEVRRGASPQYHEAKRKAMLYGIHGKRGAV